jgi:cytoskeletal protein CcmA (bactofilin family)
MSDGERRSRRRRVAATHKEARREGLIGRELVVLGAVQGRGDLRVDGLVEGPVELDGALRVGAGGRVVGDTRVTELDLEGELRGPVDAAEAATIRGTGRLLGDIRTSRLAIDDGGVLQGGIEMDFEEDA